MLRHKIIVVAIICVAIASGILSNHAQSYSPEGQAIAEVFLSPNCQNPCFYGIKPGETTEQELIDWLESQSIDYFPTDITSTIEWIMPDQDLFPRDRSSIKARIKNGRVDQLVGPFNIPVLAVEELFGAPPVIQVEDRAFTPVYLNYPCIGLSFQVQSGLISDGIEGYTGITFAFMLTWPGNRETPSWSEYPPGEPVTQCTSFGTLPCILPTATPTALPTHTLTATNTPTVTPPPATG